MNEKAIIHVVGPFTIERADGSDITPRGKRAKALLALLALAPKAVRSRRWLQDKLWSDRPQEQGAASLRQELSGVRRHFRDAGVEFLLTDRELVRLDLGRVTLPAPDPDPAARAETILEGFDIRDPEFEEWLREERSRWSVAGDLTVSRQGGLPLPVTETGGPVALLDGPRHMVSAEIGQPAAGAPAATQASAAAMPVIVLQDFGAIGNSERAELFAQGLTDELLTVLGALSGAIVTKTSETAKSNAAGYSLSGHVREAGRLRITAQLFSIATGSCIWTGRFDYENDASFDAQEEIARKVVEATQIQLSDGEWARIWADTSTSLRAWESFQRGRVMEAQVRRDALQQARRHYRDCLFLDPDFAPAMVSLAFCLVDEIRLGWSANPSASRDEAWSLCEKVLARGPANPYVRSLVAFLTCIDGDHDRACALMHDVVAEAPESPELLAYYGVLRSYNAQIDKAIALFEHALRLTPHPPGWIKTNLALAYLVNHDPRAAPHLEAAIQENPQGVRAHMGMVVTAVRRNDAEMIRHWSARLREIEPQFRAENWRTKECFRDQTIHERIAAELRTAGF